MKMNEVVNEMNHIIIIIIIMIIVMVIVIIMVMINVMINVFLSIQIIRVFTHSSIIYISWLVWISPSFVIDCFIIFVMSPVMLRHLIKLNKN